MANYSLPFLNIHIHKLFVHLTKYLQLYNFLFHHIHINGFTSTSNFLFAMASIKPNKSPTQVISTTISIAISISYPPYNIPEKPKKDNSNIPAIINDIGIPCSAFGTSA